jgi:AcrR family transcriptional regulator
VARALNLTRGAFYRRFRDHQDLTDALLTDWQETNSVAMLAALTGEGTPSQRIRALIEVWVGEVGYSSKYDVAVRTWSTSSRRVARTVRTIDEQRVAALRALFSDAGYDKSEAFVRARIFYFHQVGYYSMGVKEPTATRRARTDAYMRILTGFRSETEAFSAPENQCE